MKLENNFLDIAILRLACSRWQISLFWAM